jgi:hypothetical protein
MARSPVRFHVVDLLSVEKTLFRMVTCRPGGSGSGPAARVLRQANICRPQPADAALDLAQPSGPFAWRAVPAVVSILGFDLLGRWNHRS